MKFALRALQHRNYRLFVVGQGISLIGSWMQVIAVGWMTYRLTNSAFLLGLVGFFGQLPTFLFAPIAGVLADHWNRRRILIVTQAMAMIQAFMLAVLSLSGAITVWQIMVLSIFLGLINSFDMPVRNAFVIDMVDKKDLSNAIALNSLMFNGARLLGPSLAGVLIALVGEGTCFLINSLSFLAVIAALSAMRLEAKKAPQKRESVVNGLREGFMYVANHAPIRYILLLVTLISVMGMSYATLMPVFARDVLGGGPHTLGFLMGAVGIGALIGGSYLALRKNIRGLEKVIPAMAFIFGASLIAFSFSRTLWISLLLMLIVGFGMIAQMASSNTLLQSLADDDKRGRVMSFYTVAFMGMVPFGSLLAGAMADKIGAPLALSISGAICIIGAVAFSGKIHKIRESASSFTL